MRRHVKRTQQAPFLSSEYYEQNGTFRLSRIRGECEPHFDKTHGSGAIFFGSEPYLISTHALVVVMRADDDRLGAKGWIRAFLDSHNVKRSSGTRRENAVMDSYRRILQESRFRLKIAIDHGLQLRRPCPGICQQLPGHCV